MPEADGGTVLATTVGRTLGHSCLLRLTARAPSTALARDRVSTPGGKSVPPSCPPYVSSGSDDAQAVPNVRYDGARTVHATGDGADLARDGSENGCLWSNVGYSGARWRIGGRSGREVAAVFLGTHTPRLDEKGRLFLPARFRDELAEGVVMTRGQERCLYVWPRGEFVRFTEQLRAAPITHRGARDFARMLAAGASDECPTKRGRGHSGRPARLRGPGSGLHRRRCDGGVEIWAAAAWEAYQAEKGRCSPTSPRRCCPASSDRFGTGRPGRPYVGLRPARPSWRTFPGARRVVSSGRGPGRTDQATHRTRSAANRGSRDVDVP